MSCMLDCLEKRDQRCSPSIFCCFVACLDLFWSPTNLRTWICCLTLSWMQTYRVMSAYLVGSSGKLAFASVQSHRTLKIDWEMKDSSHCQRPVEPESCLFSREDRLLGRMLKAALLLGIRWTCYEADNLHELLLHMLPGHFLLLGFCSSAVLHLLWCKQ